jgi:ribosomal protein S28E/S33
MRLGRPGGSSQVETVCARTYRMDTKRVVVGPERCPDCGSFELAKVARRTSLHGEINAVVCKVCDWSTDPRVGRPAADRSKNFTLRRMLRSRAGSR